MNRTPAEIAAEAQHLVDNSSRQFVPAPIVRLGELAAEFMTATAAALETLAVAQARTEPVAPVLVD